jgi:hypothetical protein
MCGYFEKRNHEANEEVRELDFSEVVFVSEDEKEEFDLNRVRLVYGRRQRCPRCDSPVGMLSGLPYCSECNWDSINYLNREDKSWDA